MILSAQVWASLTLVFLKIFFHIRVKNILKQKSVYLLPSWFSGAYLEKHCPAVESDSKKTTMEYMWVATG